MKFVTSFVARELEGLEIFRDNVVDTLEKLHDSKETAAVHCRRIIKSGLSDEVMTEKGMLKKDIKKL